MGIPYTLLLTTAEKGGDKLVSEHFSDQYTELLVLGGDGTFHEVINGLDDFSLPIGIVQSGTGNDFSKALGPPLSLIEQLEIALSERVGPIDLGVCNDRLFHNGVGIGFDGWVAHRTAALRKTRPSSVWSYYQAVTEGIFGFRSPQLEFSNDLRNERKKHFMITVGNGVAFGGGFRVTPSAKVDDGCLDVCAVQKVSIPGRLWRLPFLTLGKHLRLPAVNYFQTDKLSIHTPTSIAAHIDGEVFEATSFEIEIRPQLLKLRR